MGGTAQAVQTDVTAFLAAGLRVGVVLFRCGRFFTPDETENPALLALLDQPGVTAAPGRTGSLFLHNPQIFAAAQLAAAAAPLALPRAERRFIVAHHPPFMGDGALCYDPVSVTRALARLGPEGGQALDWLPVSGLVRRQLNSFLPALRLHPLDWPNAFDCTRWAPRRTRLAGPGIVIGRHGRAHPDKWPDSGQAIADSLPAGPDTRVRLLGAEPAFFAARGVDVSDWDILPFGAEDPADFLDTLDLFSYFHADQWREAFGRTVAEAMLTGVPCLLDHRLRPTFGDHALYARPDEVPGLVSAIRADPAPHLARAARAAAWCAAAFDAGGIAERLSAVRAARATRRADGPRSSPPLTTLRKWIGFHRRASRHATHPTDRGPS